MSITRNKSMPMSDPIFGCTKCALWVTYPDFDGIFSYQIFGTLIDIDHKLGWCGKCASIRFVEVLPSATSLERLRTEYDRLSSEIENAKMALRNRGTQPGQFGDTESILPGNLEHLQSEVIFLSRTIENQGKLLVAMAGRKSGPRCLLCGSRKVKYLPAFERDTEANGQQSINAFIHPNCGGRLTVGSIPIEISFSSVMSHRTYDHECKWIGSRYVKD